MLSYLRKLHLTRGSIFRNIKENYCESGSQVLSSLLPGPQRVLSTEPHKWMCNNVHLFSLWDLVAERSYWSPNSIVYIERTWNFFGLWDSYLHIKDKKSLLQYWCKYSVGNRVVSCTHKWFYYGFHCYYSCTYDFWCLTLKII